MNTARFSFFLLCFVAVDFAAGYDCPKPEYEEGAKAFKNILTPHCDKMNDGYVKKLFECVENPEFPFQSMVDNCKEKEAQSNLEYMEALCDDDDEKTENMICCLTATLMDKVENPPSAMERGKDYEKCLNDTVV